MYGVRKKGQQKELIANPSLKGATMKDAYYTRHIAILIIAQKESILQA